MHREVSYLLSDTVSESVVAQNHPKTKLLLGVHVACMDILPD